MLSSHPKLTIHHVATRYRSFNIFKSTTDPTPNPKTEDIMKVNFFLRKLLGVSFTFANDILSILTRFSGAVIPVLVIATVVMAQQIPEKAYSSLRWRNVGPYRAGWATMAVGIPGQPNTFYFGAAGGGIWKSTDAGITWQPEMQHEGASTVGAIDVSLSDPNIIYVGTGQVAFRYDMLAGDGVYKSTDGGKTWENVGLKKTLHIGRIIIDPTNPDRVLVAALGNVFAPNSERGVFLTTDGGKTWNKTLFVSDSAGAVDLASDPESPNIVYAATWQVEAHPWLDYFMPQVGPGSGIFKSTDGGEHWTRLEGNGLPSGPLGRIGLGVARGSKGQIVYATIIASDGKSGLYRSENGGADWTYINHYQGFANNYFSRVTVDPTNPDILYVMDRSIHKSVDGGKTFTIFKGSPGGDDYHFMWINPDNTNYMVIASDQGCAVSVDGGNTWSSWYNQPTGQFYHVAVDNQFPYKIYGGQQDNGTVGILSRGPYGVIGLRDWHPVGGDERDYEVPKPGDPNLVFGSGLGGHFSRFNNITRQVAEISPWPLMTYGERESTVKYRYTWITPLAFSPVGTHALYVANQYLWKSMDDGNHWKRISPDLTGKVTGARDYAVPTRPEAFKAGYGVIFTIDPSPLSAKVIWIGTDDGLIQLTTDGGKTWTNVTPKAIPQWARVDAIDPSHFSAHAAYAAVNTQRLGYMKPLILKTTDDGKTWQTISNGLPADQFTNCVRCDPVKKRLLYAATNRSVYVSFNDGSDWQPLTLNLPTVCVNDMVVHDNDLVICTQGRAFWVLDDVEPLREISSALVTKPVHLFRPSLAIRMRPDENKDTPWPPSTALGQNPPTGAIVDYWLKDDASGPITLTFRDSRGNVIRSFTSNETQPKLPSHRYFQAAWIKSPQELSTSAGEHRFVWDLRYPRPKALRYEYDIAAVWPEGGTNDVDAGTPLDPQGPLVLPGRYTVTLEVHGKSYTEPFQVKEDPRVHITTSALEEQIRFSLQIDKALDQTVGMHNEIEKALEGTSAIPVQLRDALTNLQSKGKPNVSTVAGNLASLATAVGYADGLPTQGEMAVYTYCGKELDGLLAKWHGLAPKISKGSR